MGVGAGVAMPTEVVGAAAAAVAATGDVTEGDTLRRLSAIFVGPGVETGDFSFRSSTG